MPTVLDAAFRDAGQKDGLEIWRIEAMKVRPVEKQQYGYFHNGDCYIILKSYGTPARSWNIHFWIGDHSSVDEQTVAAYKSVELDGCFDGRPVQYRETQQHESKLFLSYFKNGIRYLDGGVDGGLRPAQELGLHRLFQVKGRRNCRMQQVPLNVDSLNKGDVFILDANDVIYVWHGPDSNRGERIKGIEIARSIRDGERAGRPRIVLIDDDWHSNAHFFAELDSSPFAPIAAATEDDSAHEQHVNKQLKLFRVSDQSGIVTVTEVDGPYSQNSLDSQDCFFLDLGPSGIFAWLGRGCTAQERKAVWKMAQGYLHQRKLPTYTPIVKVTEGNEPAIFRVAMNYSIDLPHKMITNAQSTGLKDSLSKSRSIDVRSLHTTKPQTQADYMPDSGRGDVRVWRIVKFSLSPLPLDEYGVFYSGDSYVVYYTSETIRAGIVYFWLGSKSSIDERASAAMFAAQVDDRESLGAATQIRVVQSKEPAHFLAIFGGMILTMLGGVASGLKSVGKTDKDGDDQKKTLRLFQVRNNRIIEVEAKAHSLNSNDMFVLETKHKHFVWIGKGSNNMERQTVVKFCERCEMRNEEIVLEGSEPVELWHLLGGKAEYATGGSLMRPNLQFTARLFQCSNARGYFHVEEIVDFSQEDLEPDDVMLLDTYSEVFIWIGQGANHAEKESALVLALEYIDSDPTGRTRDDTVTLIVKQGFEPLNFTGHFPAWDEKSWQNRQSYDQLRQSLSNGVVGNRHSAAAHPGRAFSAHQETSGAVQTVQAILDQGRALHSLDVLRQPAELLPPGVDPNAKEKYLSETDFLVVFKMTMEQFAGLPEWKRVAAKKNAGLF